MTIETLPGMPVTVERDVPAAMRDGTVLRADVYRPSERSPDGVPVLLARSPYDKRVNVSTFGNTHPAWYASHGYMVVIQDTRGRYTSEGDFYPFAHESDDGYDTVEWAATLPGSNGDVGMFGFSYVGATQLLAAVTRPPSLRSIAPGFTASQYYDGWTYNGGALAAAFVCYWANLLALGSAVRAEDRAAVDALGASLGAAEGWFWSLPLSEFPPLQGGYAPYFYDWLEHCTYDDYWKQWSIDSDYSRIEVPALHFGGWWDVFLSGTVKNFTGLSAGAGTEAARRAQKLLVGPWTHMPWTPVSRCGGDGPSTNEIDDWQLRWFDHTLKGVDTGVLDHPVTVFTLDGGWRDLDGWPPSDTVAEDWYIHSRGRANSKFGDGTLDRVPPAAEPPDIFVYDPGVPIPSMGGHSCCFDTITPMGPADQHQAEVSRMILVYTSEPLADDIELLGDVSVTVHAASTATRHRLHRPAVRGRSRRPQRQPPGGHPEGPLPPLAQRARAARSRRGLRAAHRPRPRRRPRAGRVAAAARLIQLGLPPVGPQPQHGRHTASGQRSSGSPGHPDRAPQHRPPDQDHTSSPPTVGRAARCRTQGTTTGRTSARGQPGSAVR